MFLASRAKIYWRRWSYLLSALLIAPYVASPPAEQIFGRTARGLVYGSIGLILVLVLMSYGARKRAYRSSWGSVEGWLQAHIYLGLVALVTVLLHSGFRFQNIVAIAAFVLLLLVTLSGVWGVVLYAVIPPKLSATNSNLTIVNISGQINELGRSMAALALGKSAPFQQIHANLLAVERAGYLAAWRCLSRHYLEKRLAQDPAGSFDHYVGSVPPEEQTELAQLLALAHQRNDLHDSLIRRQRYVNLMGAWLYLHVPLSFALLVAVAAHVIVFFYYG
ncbi:MAG TPA: hypothetical protein VIH18_17770 [Candidatus Binatia bacterium]|jgi:hypothetical protein